MKFKHQQCVIFNNVIPNITTIPSIRHTLQCQTQKLQRHMQMDISLILLRHKKGGGI